MLFWIRENKEWSFQLLNDFGFFWGNISIMQACHVYYLLLYIIPKWALGTEIQNDAEMVRVLSVWPNFCKMIVEWLGKVKTCLKVYVYKSK